MSKRAVGYFRLMESDDAEGWHAATRREWIKITAKSRGYELVRIYKDDIGQAIVLCERLLPDARAKQFDVVIGCETLDGSDGLEVAVIEELLTLGIEIETDKDNQPKRSE